MAPIYLIVHLVNFVGAFLNHFINKPYEQWNPLLAFAEAALGTLIQGCGAQVKNIPAVQKYIANILIDVGKNPGIFKHFILYPWTLKSWRILKELDDKSGINKTCVRQNLDLLTKMSVR
ncbi:MAG: hypothetical protein IPJ13_13670 [Saprospiraceae bacterium]|nr:hypothetical protein [Saprospiraceae bacterium]